MLFLWTLYLLKNPAIKCVKFSTKIFFNIDNIDWAANQHIRMISERSCDTKHLSNDVEHSAFRNKLHLQHIDTETAIQSCNISQYFCFHCISDQIIAALVSRRDFQK